jgi:hypothetical protein
MLPGRQSQSELNLTRRKDAAASLKVPKLALGLSMIVETFRADADLRLSPGARFLQDSTKRMGSHNAP